MKPMKTAPETQAKLMPDQYLDSIQKDTCRISFCERFDEKSRIWNYAKHAHSCIELIYFLEGKADIQDEDHTMALSLFELVIYPPDVFHQEFLDTRYHQAIICVHLECETSLAFDRLFKKTTGFTPAAYRNAFSSRPGGD